MPKIKIILSFILTIAVLQGAMLGFLRYQIERDNRTVELAADYSDLETMSALSNYPVDKLLKDLKEMGITSLGLAEETPAQASANGELFFSSGRGILDGQNTIAGLKSYVDRKLILPDRTYFFVKSDEIRKRAANHLLCAIDEKKIKFIGPEIIEVDEPEGRLRNLGIGFSAATLKKLEGFHIIPRLSNEQRYDIPKKIGLLKGFDTVVFDGEEILGYPDRIPELASSLKENKIKYGYVEIIKQFGNTKLKKIMGNGLVRVHSISKDELKKTDQNVAIERFGRAVKERGIRLIYLRPYLSAKDAMYFSAVKNEVEKAGMKIGPASSPQEFSLTHNQVVILGLGVAVGLIMLLDAFLELKPLVSVVILLFAGLGLYFYNLPSLIVQQLLALAATIIFPAIAVINGFSKPLPLRNLYASAAIMVVNIAAEASIGAIIITGLLCDTRFMLGAESFIGVKTALMLPILIVSFCFLVKGEDDAINYNKIKEKISSYLKLSIPVPYLLAFGFFMLAGLVLLARSGNFVLPVPGFEKSLRSLLENILSVRPRFKEFMIGYPALFFSAILFLRNRKEWLWVLLAAGAIAPVSLVNSFSHIHTPLAVSMLRSANGLIIGIIFGIIFSRVKSRLDSTDPPKKQ